MKFLDNPQARPRPFKRLEEESHRSLDLRIGFKGGLIQSVMHKTNRNHLLEFASPGTAQDATSQSCFEYVQFRFAHCAFQAQQ